MLQNGYYYFDRDLSWLQFNSRVLEEAENVQVPLYERVRFLSIFSSNLDEFFRVRYPALVARYNTDHTGKLPEIQATVNGLQPHFGAILNKQILPALREHKVHLYYGEKPTEEHRIAASDFFRTKLIAYLHPVALAANTTEKLENNKLYLLVKLAESDHVSYLLLNIPCDYTGRFLALPGEEYSIMFTDDVLRENIDHVFPGRKVLEYYAVKMTLNGDVSIKDEWSAALEEEVQEMISAREISLPTRFLYEAGMPEDMKRFVRNYFGLSDAELIEGGRYHNLKDLADLPLPQNKALQYPAMPALRQSHIDQYVSTFEALRQEDVLINVPYQSYGYVLRFFNEAMIDPFVEEIYVTLYRVAADSQIASTLISAANNGKRVTVFIELKARFDEANNLNWAKRMKAAGVRIIYSIPEMKVHAKIALVKRKEGWKSEYFGLLATGNFNEQTARFYTDHILMTSNADITRELDLLFAYLPARTQPDKYDFLRFHELLVSGFNMKDRFTELIYREMEHARNGKSASVTIKLNNLEEQSMIDLLYDASNAGVQIQLVIRGICCLVPGVAGMSEHITVRRIVDRFLEHGRVFIFSNDGNPETYMGSADWMTRNLKRRIEVVFPVYSKSLQEQLKHLIELQLCDNVQARIVNADGSSSTIVSNDKGLRSQTEIYEYLKDQQ
ncbi:polyphosphate kinase 1 [Chitinophagaceae bacterium MMS25-I14]